MNPLNLIRATYGDVWAISDKLHDAFRGLPASSGERVPATVGKRLGLPPAKGSVAVLPLTGVITQRGGGILSCFFDVTSTDEFGRMFDQVIADDSVGAIVLDIDSGGGSVYGLAELAEKIRSARGAKPIIAVANSEAFSAAYYLAVQADKLYVTPSGQVGSIGTRLVHVDLSEANAEAGEKVTHIYAGKYKVEANSDEPLDKEAKDYLQSIVDRYYTMFVDDVAKGRGVTPTAVKADFGQGRVFGAKEAVAAGMADQVATLDDVIGSLVKTSKGRGNTSATTNDAPTVVSSQGAALEVPVDPEEEDDKGTPRKDAAVDRFREARFA